jgi:hypothetical protein
MYGETIKQLNLERNYICDSGIYLLWFQCFVFHNVIQFYFTYALLTLTDSRHMFQQILLSRNKFLHILVQRSALSHSVQYHNIAFQLFISVTLINIRVINRTALNKPYKNSFKSIHYLSELHVSECETYFAISDMGFTHSVQSATLN